MTIYYNEFEPYAAAMLRNLITAGLIADGVVDTRSIEDVQPDDLREFTQCHFFAGIGVWSYALRAAGWPDDRPVWTGSCPCQPFSAAGKGLAFADERHLWPAFHHLIKVGKPECVLGEQVASKDIDSWIDLVHADLEALGYAFGSVPFPSAGVGAPHIRDRNYWVADANDSGRQRRRTGEARNGRDAARFESERLRNAGGLGDANGESTRRDPGSTCRAQAQIDGQDSRDDNGLGHAGDNFRRLADASGERRIGREGIPSWRIDGWTDAGWVESDNGSFGVSQAGVSRFDRPGPTNGFWRDADWLGCTDGKWRPVEPGTFPLAHGATGRVGRLRAYGNAINAEAARVWIECVMEAA